ncbi:hypothetical protein BGX24_002954 [Mortierella sp. AD032]|nr:hypothetical protein BGX24_002954 [Mortierella sp. AD032]
MSEDPRLQSLQRGPNGRVFQVEAHLHADSNQHIVFWDDIFEAFPGATNVLNGTVIVTRARDASLRLIDPKCIKYHPGKVLQVAGGEDMGISLGESTFIPTSVPLSKVYAQELTRKNIEQWAAMTIPEEMMITGGIYAPTICTLTTTETRPFKPLLVRTEADASSIRATSARGSDKEYGDDDTLENNQEGDQGAGNNTAGREDNGGKDNTYIPIAISNQESMGVPATDPFASPPQALVHNTGLVNLDSPTYPQRAL